MKKTIIKTCSCFFDVALMYLNSDELPSVCDYQLDCYRLCKWKEVFVLQEVTLNTVAYPEVNLGTLRARSTSVGKSAGGL